MEELSGLDFTPFQDQWLLEGCTLQLVSRDFHMTLYYFTTACACREKLDKLLPQD